MANNLYPDIEAQKMVVCDDVITAGNDPEHIVYVPSTPACGSDVLPTRVYAPQPSPDHCGMGTIGFWEIACIVQILNKFLYTVGKEEMPEKVQHILLCFMVFCTFSYIIVDCCSKTKEKLVLPCFGAQVIRLAGILILVSCILYGYLKKNDILFSYNYCTKTNSGFFIAVLFWLCDFLIAYWLAFVVYKCYVYLRDLNKNYPYADVYEIY